MCSPLCNSVAMYYVSPSTVTGLGLVPTMVKKVALETLLLLWQPHFLSVSQLFSLKAKVAIYPPTH